MEKKLYVVQVIGIPEKNAAGQIVPDKYEFVQHAEAAIGFKDIFPTGTDFIQCQIMEDAVLTMKNKAGKEIKVPNPQPKAITWLINGRSYPDAFNKIKAELDAGTYKKVGDYKGINGKIGVAVELTDYMELGAILHFACDEHYRMNWSETDKRYTPLEASYRNPMTGQIEKQPVKFYDEIFYLHGNEADAEDVAKARVIAQLTQRGAFTKLGVAADALPGLDNQSGSEVDQITKTAEKP